MMSDFINRQMPKARAPPAYLPFKSVAEVLAFNFTDDEGYTDLVSIYVYFNDRNTRII